MKQKRKLSDETRKKLSDAGKRSAEVRKDKYGNVLFKLMAVKRWRDYKENAKKIAKQEEKNIKID